MNHLIRPQVVSDAVSSKAVVLMLISCLLILPPFCVAVVYLSLVFCCKITIFVNIQKVSK